MTKKLLLTMLIMALLAGNALAQGGYTVKIGGTYANFRNQGSERDLGFTLGIGREWKISKRTGLALELMYTAKKTALKNKIVASAISGYGSVIDIYSDIRYIEIPFMWKYYRQVRKTLSIELYVGPSLELAIKERTKTKRLYNFYDPQHKLRYDYVFYEGDDPWPWLSRSGFNVNGGIAIGWSGFIAELRYSRALHDVDVISDIALNENLDFLQLLIGLKF